MNDLMLHRAAQLLEAEFGPQWRTVADMLGTEGLRKRVGKELTSFMAYPERGAGGNSQWRGNCSPEVVAALLRYCLTISDIRKRYQHHFTHLRSYEWLWDFKGGC